MEIHALNQDPDQSPMVGKVIGTRDEPITFILLNGSIIKLPPKYFYLYPHTSAALSLDQHSPCSECWINAEIHHWPRRWEQVIVECLVKWNTRIPMSPTPRLREHHRKWGRKNEPQIRRGIWNTVLWVWTRSSYDSLHRGYTRLIW